MSAGTVTREDVDQAHEALEQNGNGAAALPAAPLEELRVDGTTQLGMIDFGGKSPTSASLTLRGGAVKLVDGQAYRKGDVIHFEGTAVINDVGGKDAHDPKTGIVVSAEQRHGARITDLRVTGAEQA